MTQDDSSVPATQKAINDAAALNKIDWTAIRTSTCFWTFEELSHYSHCRVSPYVFAVARALCSQFNISASAKKELADLKQRLSTALGDESSHHILRMLIASDDDWLTALGICGILNDYFHSAALAEFFETLAKMSAMPEALRPARGRWMELARICGKIQAPASFHSLAQNCSQLGLVENSEDLDEGLGPIGVVEFIQGMSQISSGEDEGSIVMLCGRSAGWCAAIAEWMFGLRIKLTTRDGLSIEGKTVYSNCQDDQVQLTLTFNNPGIPMEGGLVDDPSMPIKYQKED